MKCQALASDAWLAGQYRAWITTDTRTPDGVFSPSPAAYRLVDGTLVATDRIDLTTQKSDDTFLAAAIALDEHGVAVTGEMRVWTGTTVAGTGGFPTCDTYGPDWRYTAPGSVGFRGEATSRHVSWTEYGTAACATPLRLYCVQQ